MSATAASYRKSQPRCTSSDSHGSLSLIDRVHNYIDAQPSAGKCPPKFDAAFLERRMQAHREWQAQETADLATGIILEVKIALEAYDVAD